MTDAALGNLPNWNLADLYSSPDAPELAKDFERVDALCSAMQERFEGKVAGLDADGLADALVQYETISEVFGRIMSFAGLLYQENTQDAKSAKFFGDCQAQVTDQSAKILFFELELNKVDDDALQAMIPGNETLQRYKPWLDRLRAFRPHQLSDELEKFLHDQGVVGSGAWVRLFDEQLSAMVFDMDGELLTLEGGLNKLSDPNRENREAAAHALAAGFRANLPLFSRILNTLVKEKEVSDRWRKHETPQSARHLANDVEPEVVNALRDAVVDAYPRLSHRYFALKAKWLGLEKLEYWDRNAPLSDKALPTIPWEQARDTVLDAYRGFAPEMATLAQRFFDESWIDAPVRPGKASGAFAHPTVVSAHPYVLVNYLGKPRDVMTLAHELGHGVHQLLAAEQGEFLSQTPLTLAETASVFGEMLTFQSLLKAETDPARRRVLLAGKVEDMLNTVVRQIAFYEFESRVHAARREGELTSDDIGELWLGVQKESLGPAFNFADGYDAYWTYVSHFIHTPFYVYAYAFGDGLVNALYARYQDGAEGFQQRYFEMLRAGGSKHHKELLAPFGLDASDPDFWAQGLGVIEGMIDELEAMEA